MVSLHARASSGTANLVVKNGPIERAGRIGEEPFLQPLDSLGHVCAGVVVEAVAHPP